MTRADFERLTAGQFVFTHMGTSYRSVCIVSLDLAAGTLTVECPALRRHPARMLRQTCGYGAADVRPYKPSPGRPPAARYARRTPG